MIKPGLKEAANRLVQAINWLGLHPMPHVNKDRWSDCCRLMQEHPSSVSFGSYAYPRRASPQEIADWEATEGKCSCGAAEFNEAFEQAEAVLNEL